MAIELATAVGFSDADLLNEVKRLAAHERHATARLVAALAELDARRLYLAEGCSSLFVYCTQVLHVSEHAAYLRIEAARAARKWPAILELLAEGALHLTAIGLLAPHLTADNLEGALAAARHKSKREVEEIVAALRPRPAVPSSVRRLPAERMSPALIPGQAQTQTPDRQCAQPTVREQITPPACAKMGNASDVRALAPERFRVQFTISRQTQQQLREAQDLLRHSVPDGDIAVIFGRALTLLLADLHKKRHAAVQLPRATGSSNGRSRHVPASVKRAVWQRDQGQCAFRGTAGRCTERDFLEYHHQVPYADGGATSTENLELRCRAHNTYEAHLWFGAGEDDMVRETPPTYASW